MRDGQEEDPATAPQRSKLEAAILRNNLKQTLVRMGLTKSEAGKAIDHAFEMLGLDGKDVELIREALNFYRALGSRVLMRAPR